MWHTPTCRRSCRHTWARVGTEGGTVPKNKRQKGQQPNTQIPVPVPVVFLVESVDQILMGQSVKWSSRERSEGNRRNETHLEDFCRTEVGSSAGQQARRENHREVHNRDQEQETKQQDATVWREKVVWMMPKDNIAGRRWILFISSEFSSVSGSSVLPRT